MNTGEIIGLVGIILGALGIVTSLVCWKITYNALTWNRIQKKIRKIKYKEGCFIKINQLVKKAFDINPERILYVDDQYKQSMINQCYNILYQHKVDVQLSYERISKKKNDKNL